MQRAAIHQRYCLDMVTFQWSSAGITWLWLVVVERDHLGRRVAYGGQLCTATTGQTRGLAPRRGTAEARRDLRGLGLSRLVSAEVVLGTDLAVSDRPP
jgi:hypothetical protein